MTMALGGKVVSKRSARPYIEDEMEKGGMEYQGKKQEETGQVPDERRISSTTTSSRVDLTGSLPVEVDRLPAANEPASDASVYAEKQLLPPYPFLVEDPEANALLAGTARPANFGIVVPGVYRSSYPQVDDQPFVESLNLKTIITLVSKDFSGGYKAFIKQRGIRHHIFNMRGTKKEDIPIQTMKSILRLVLDQRNHPLLIHCNHGKHRTGCVVGIIRKVTGWNLDRIISEYTMYAEPKARECDIKYISGFQLGTISSLFTRESQVQGRVRNLVQASLFSFCFLSMWLVSVAKLFPTKQS